jgi:hypothetical protein
MIQEAARIIAEQQQQQRHAQKSSLRRFGSRCNRTLKLLLAIPSSPDIKTYSKTRTRSPPRQMALPLGAMASALSAQQRIPKDTGARSRPSTSASPAQRSDGGSRRHSMVGSLGSLRGMAEAAYMATSRRIHEHPARDAMFREAEHSLTHVFGPAATTVSEGSVTRRPTQEQIGNKRWGRLQQGGRFGPQTSRLMGCVEGAATGQMPTGQMMPGQMVPGQRYAASFKSSDTTVLPTQSHIYGNFI